jgi:hypothetical protein
MTQTRSDVEAPARSPRPEDRVLEVSPESHPWSSPLALIAISGLVLFVVDHFVRSHWAWYRPFLRDLWRWIRHPEVAGGWAAPARPLLAVAVFVAAGTLGRLATRLLLRGTRYGSERTLAAGLSITLGVCLLGYGGMLGVALGLLSAPALLAFYAVVAAVLIWLTRRAGGAAAAPEPGEDLVDVTTPVRPAPRGLKPLTAGLGAVIFVLILAHSALSPVQEWDAMVYHAESAQLWFQERPSPAIIYGPSVGIEISANYPPLFPAAGAATYTLLDRFDDLYLRILPPLLFLAILLMAFGYARRRLGEDAACYAVLLMLGTPLLVLYSAWPTAYILLAALVLATVILSDIAAESGSRTRWALAGGVAGLAMLSHVYGVIAIPIGVVAVVMARRRRVAGPLVFVGVALLVAAPWLLRNFVLLHDPLYPLGSPPFHGIGLIQPIWDATKEEIRSAALGFWGISGVSMLRANEVSTALFDRHLLPVGLYFGLILGLSLWRRHRVMAYLALALSGLILTLLLPGWYWLRGIVPGLPIAALLTGRGIAMLLAAGQNARHGVHRIMGTAARAVTVVAVTGGLAAGALVGLGLAVAGPNQETWTTALSPGQDLMGGVRVLGSTRDTLWSVFGGDALMWQWLNTSVPSGEKVATLEVRIYYIDRPQDLFYLDGLEAAPLLALSDPSKIQAFLLSKGVHFIALPSWAAQGDGAHPVTHLMPLFRFLGSDRFPVAGVFPSGSEVPTMVYSVGPTKVEPSVGVFPGGAEPEPALVDPSFAIPARATDPRIFAPVNGDELATLEFEFQGSGRGAVSFNLYDPVAFTWDVGFLRLVRPGGPGWFKAAVPLTGSPQGYVDLGLFVSDGTFHMRNLRVVRPAVPVAQGMGSETGPGGTVSVVAVGGTHSQIMVPVGSDGTAVLSLSYLDASGGSFDVSVQSPGGGWEPVVVQRALGGSRRWITMQVDVRANRPGFVPVRVVAHGLDLRIEDLRVAP